MEPPHRGDSDNVPLHTYAKRMLMPVVENNPAKNMFLSELTDLLAKVVACVLFATCLYFFNF